MRQKLRQSENVLTQRGRVFRDADGVEAAQLAGEIGGQRSRRGDGQRGLQGIDIHRRYVQFETRMQLFGKNTEHAARGNHVRKQREIGRQPIRPFSLLQDGHLIAHLQTRHRPFGIDVDQERNRCIRMILTQRIGRAFDRNIDVAVDDFDFIDRPAGHGARGLVVIVCVETECALRAAQVGRLHAGQFVAGRGRRVVRGHTHHRHGNAMLAESLPKCLAPAQRLHMRTRERENIRPERKTEAWWNRLIGRKKQIVRMGVAVHEIEDAVLGGIEAGGERRPCDRALRWRGGGESREAAPTPIAPHAVEIGQIGPMAFDETGIHAVDADDDHLLIAVSSAGDL